MNGQLPGNLLPWLIWEKFRFYDYHGGGRNKQQGQQQPGNGKNQSHRYHVSYNQLLVRVREQSKYNIPCFSSGMRLENCRQFQIVHIRFVDSTYLVLISIPSRTMLRYFIKLLMAVIECKNPLRFVEEYRRAQYISVAASFYTNHHWRHRMGSSKLHPKNAIELWGLFVSKLPNYFHILPFKKLLSL